MTAGLLVKFMQKERSLLLPWFSEHITRCWLGKQKCMFPADRRCTRMCTIKEDMLLIPDISSGT